MENRRPEEGCRPRNVCGAYALEHRIALLRASPVKSAREESLVATAKEQIARLLEQQPDDSTVEELVRELALSIMIDRGIRDSDAGRTISNEEMRHRIRQWRK